VVTKPAVRFVWSFESPAYPCFFTTRCVFGSVIVQPTFPAEYFLVELLKPPAACANSLGTVCQILQVFVATDGFRQTSTLALQTLAAIAIDLWPLRCSAASESRRDAE